MEQDRRTQIELALVVFSHEWADGSTRELHGAAQLTFEKLNIHFSKRLGTGGYSVLLKRAVMLATAEYAWLETVYVTKDGLLEGLAAASQAETTQDTAAGCIAVLASLIGLLDTFIGRTLCLRLLSIVWPESLKIETDDTQGNSNG